MNIDFSILYRRWIEFSFFSSSSSSYAN